MNPLRVISSGRYDSRGYSNESSMAALMLERPEEINMYLTYTYGLDNNRFPLTFLTEGQGSVGVKDISTLEWTYKVMGKQKFNDYVVGADASSKPGLGGSLINVWFATDLITEQYGLIAPDGITAVRVMKYHGKDNKGHRYTLKLKNPDPSSYVDPSLFTVGKYWSMTAPTVSLSFSKGNKANAMAPGQMKNQLSVHRYTKVIAGNIANAQVHTYQFKTANGGTTNRWISEEMRQFDVQMRVMNEEHLWLSRYNRNENSVVTMKDLDNGEVITEGAGMFEMCQESNFDSYGEFLTLNKLNRTIGDVLSSDTDNGESEIALFGGKGGIQDFQKAIKRDAKDNGFLNALGDKTIMDNGKYLKYGREFDTYTTPDGHKVTVKHLPMLDFGTLPENDKSNGNIHPVTGLPMSSHQLLAVDMSTYDGERNTKMVRLKGASYAATVRASGLSAIPDEWKAVGVTNCNEVDAAQYEVKMTRGLQCDRTNKMFMLKCVL